LWSNWRTHISPNQGDPLFVLYLLKWVGHEAGRGFAGFWDAPFFYPTKGVLAYSEHMLGPGLAASAWNAVVPGWVGAYNALFLSSFAFTGWAMSWTLRRARRSWWAALLGGALYAFCPFRWDQLPHLQVLLMAAIPLTLWSFDRLLMAPSPARAGAFLLCYALHLSGGCYLAAMIHVPLLVLACNRLIPAWRRGALRAGLAVLAATLAVSAGLLAFTFWQYWRIGARDALAWSSAAERHWGASLLSYLQPSDSNFYSGLWPRFLFRSENCLFPGWLAIALCLAAILLHRRQGSPASPEWLNDASSPGRARARWRFAPLALVAFGWTAGELLTWSERPGLDSLARWTGLRGYGLPLALVLAGAAAWAVAGRRLTGRWPWARVAALDPWPRGLLLAGAATALLSTPLFYVPLSRALPGLSSMRVPARFHAFTMVTIAFFAAAAFDSLAALLRETPATGQVQATRKTRPMPAARMERAAELPRAHRRRAVLFTAAVLTVACVELAPRALPWTPLAEEDDFPNVYFWLAAQPDVHALLELPLEDPASARLGPASLQAMYLGTVHWRPLVNGFSAHFPPTYLRLAGICCYPMPGAATLAAIEGWGVTHILIHRTALPLWQRRALDAWGAANRAELVYAGAGDRVYRLRPPGPAQGPVP
jgi:hypothetical protein